MWKEKIESVTTYDFDYTLQRWAFDPLTKLDLEERWVAIPVKLHNENHVVYVKGIGATSDPKFEISSNSELVKEELFQHINWLFQWERDLNKVHEHFQATNLENLFNEYSGTPIVKDFHLYDCLIKVIIHQQLNMKFAYRLSTRFVENFGYKKNGVWFYPSPETVAQLEYSQLRELQFSQRKAEYVIDTSRLIAAGELDLEGLAEQSNDVVVKEMTKIRGIGPWTAENWLMFGVGRENLFPKADIGIQNALKKYFDMDRKPEFQEMVNLSKNWDPFKSYASLTLWRSIEG
ncbi:putative DNA-3-methyladenine glycosylase YfjP [Halobacillus andaensis]|uniref:DNA-3-methyladenine glycosylase II n=1 Tax=Halobacillus andaensis TaxID=1176239 RepID=A0A917EYG2_HALAA|nr:DNA-3-methyladenine glycosylase [Halobacillus andaensis]MBP2005967.1 DNA-3-methyladenine glycosylase II [Halobacillus andaensis]GGF24665.1 putative DNA-3-methyladenine glycosylase YfjP [Halobacillus andaensis]